MTHPILGDAPFSFVTVNKEAVHVIKDPVKKEKLKKILNDKVRAEVGAFAKLTGVIFVSKLPKTRSGKILRGTIKKIVNRQEYKMPATIEDVTAIHLIERLCKEHHQASQAKL